MKSKLIAFALFATTAAAVALYPAYRSVETGGLPYSPTALDTGYPCCNLAQGNVFFTEYPSSAAGKLEIPAQTGVVTVSVRDNFDRLTVKSFNIPISSLDFTDLPGNYYQPDRSCHFPAD